MKRDLYPLQVCYRNKYRKQVIVKAWVTITHNQLDDRQLQSLLNQHVVIRARGSQGFYPPGLEEAEIRPVVNHAASIGIRVQNANSNCWLSGSHARRLPARLVLGHVASGHRRLADSEHTRSRSGLTAACPNDRSRLTMSSAPHRFTAL
jgi:hypothetical protein